VGRFFAVFDFVNKLQHYPKKTKAFLEGNYSDALTTVMLYLASDICNHDCVYCDKNFYQITPKMFDRLFLDTLIDDMVCMGADSLIILGEGAEPLLCRDLCHLIENASNHGIVCGIYTNGSIVNKEITRALNHLDFVRISLDAGNLKTHAIIHQYDCNKQNYFENAINLLRSIDKKKVNTGISFILLKENMNEVYDIWKLMSELGVGYIELKLPLAKGYVFDEVDISLIQCLKNQLSQIKQADYVGTRIVLNRHLDMLLNDSFEDTKNLTIQEEMPCYTCVFRTIVSPLGYFLCSPKKNSAEARYGDPFKQSLAEAWRSEKHMKMIGRACSICCTYSRQNQVLNDLKQGKKMETFKIKSHSQTHFL